MNISKATFTVDQRREWLRVDDRLLMEYRPADETPDGGPNAMSAYATEQAIANFFAKPTQDLLAHSQLTPAESLLVPWLMKIDRALEMLLQRMTRLNGAGMTLPQLVHVNISGGGIGFETTTQFREGDVLDVRIILPPFTPIQAKVEIGRVTPTDESPPSYTLATKFSEISADDHEHLIRHILHVQAERLRTRNERATTVS